MHRAPHCGNVPGKLCFGKAILCLVQLLAERLGPIFATLVALGFWINEILDADPLKFEPLLLFDPVAFALALLLLCSLLLHGFLLFLLLELSLASRDLK